MDIEFEKRLFVSSVPLVELNADRKPIGFGSGCLIDYAGKRILLSVCHVTGNQANWAIQLRYHPGKGTLLRQLGSMHFLAKASRSNPVLRNVDFSYVEVPSDLEAYRQDIVALDQIKSEIPITVHQPSLEDVPQTGNRYGFCGLVKYTHEMHFDQFCVGADFRIHTGLSFLRTEDDYHVFRLPFDHPGHEHFKGCSGAPVLSDTGALVALVCRGRMEFNEIVAISTSAYKTALDILVAPL